MIEKKKPKILLIDEEGDLSELFQLALNHEYDIESVYTGKTAWERLKDFAPDILVTGQWLAGKNFDLVEEVRKISQVPILMISNSGSIRKSSLLKKKGVSIFVKPFTLRELKAKIQAILGS